MESKPLCRLCGCNFNKYDKSHCNHCYEQILLRGQCLNIAATLLTRTSIEFNHLELPKEVYDLANKLFKEAERQDFLKWKFERKELKC